MMFAMLNVRAGRSRQPHSRLPAALSALLAAALLPAIAIADPPQNFIDFQTGMVPPPSPRTTPSHPVPQNRRPRDPTQPLTTQPLPTPPARIRRCHR